ncbi:MAG: Fe(3+) dicitrate transport protein [Colwellia sp.]|jgi:Fe(3+) dicitrate transport protein
MKTNLSLSYRAITLVLVTTLAPVHLVYADDSAVEDKSNSTKVITEKDQYLERFSIIGHSNKLRTEAGSATLIGETELEKFKFDDINRVLYNVPGVNIREEDGYGLRPNIGFRGATPERSKKITVMEDGILIGPAPYSAPAAYYFPMMSKMTSLEVFKGPSGTKYGPNTVYGALNMTTRAVPDSQEGMIDISVGSDAYTKVHGFYGNSIGNLGFLIEAVNMQSDGFKELDGGGDTGFNKNDIMAKFRYDLVTGDIEHTFGLKISYADEHSDETYLGLTDQDFDKAPDRRYVASQQDNMDWEHQQVMLTHFMKTDSFDLTTKVYRNEFKRSWFKINGFNNTGKDYRELQEILANPYDEDGINTRYYHLLSGQEDSVGENEKLILGDNAREYYSQGIQTDLFFQQNFLGLTHKFNVGGRFHQDQIARNHTTDSFNIRDSLLVSDGNVQMKSTTDREKTDAISVFFKDTINYQALAMTVGIRGEFIDSVYQNRAPGKTDEWRKKSSHIWLPSLSLFYTLNEHAGLLFGVHEGFVPTSPKEGAEITIENSVNYEFGGRYYQGGANIEAVVFFNDMSNLKESCSFSTASACNSDLGKEVNGGEVDIYGLEFSSNYQFTLTEGLDVPVSLVYTYSDSEFKNTFKSGFPMWGDITAGDSVPYLPEHQITINMGLTAEQWDINIITRYVGEMLEASGDNVTLSGVSTEPYTVVDLSASYYLGEYAKVYLKADNLLDSQEIVSRRPNGARPSKPQQLFVGYQYNF